MRVLKPWVTPLKISPDQFMAWQNEVPPHESITFWALKNNRISASEYLSFAVDHYKLPSLKKEFFNHPVNHELWQKIQSVANWSPEMIPLMEWDHAIFIAVVEPPEEIQWSFPVQYVLADAHSLCEYWENLQSQEGIHTRYNLKLSDLDGPSTQVTTIDAPQGLKLNITGEKRVSAPEGLKLNLPDVTSPTSVTRVDTKAPAPVAASPPPPKPNLKQVPASIAPSAPAIDHTKEFTITASSTAEKAAVMVSDAPVKFPKRPDEAKSITDLINWAFNECHQHYNCAMILRLEGESLAPWKRDWRWNTNQDLPHLDLHSPSLFRIVYRTGMPYHGYVVSSATNETFFNHYKFPKLPELATAIPIQLHNEMFGIFLCIGTQASNTKEILLATERIVDKLSKHLTAFVPKVAA